MMDGNRWADFGASAVNKENDDDDWADFGGFESATPAANGSSAPGSLITWAAVAPPLSSPSTTATSSPNPVPSFNTSSETGKIPTSSIPNAPAVNDHADFIGSFLLNNQNVSPETSASSGKSLKEEENKPDYKTEYDSFHADFSSFLNEALTEPMESISDPSEDVSKEQGQKLQTQASYTNGENSAVTNTKFVSSNITAVNQETQENSPNAFDTLDKEVSSAQDILSVVMAQQQPSSLFEKPTDSVHRELTLQLQDAKKANKELEEKVDGLQGKLSISEQEKVMLQKDLVALLKKDKALEEESQNLSEMLAKQTEKYEHLQEQHENQVKEIRKAGHDTLAVIVEEYKELSRKAVLEQQECNKNEMEKLLEDQRKKFQDFLQVQRESFERTLQEEKKQNEQKASVLLDEEKQRHKEEIESYLEQERSKSKEALDKAIEDAKQQCAEAVEAARKEERRKYEEFITEHEEAVKTITDREGHRLQRLVEDVMKEEREANKVVLEEALKEERQKGKEFAEEIKEETKKEMLEYSRVKQEADRAARQKYLHGLDLFLESARAQLKMLMEDQRNKHPSSD